MTFAHFFKESSDARSTSLSSLAASVLAQALRWASPSKQKSFRNILAHLKGLSQQHPSVLSCPADIIWSAMMDFLIILPEFNLIIDAIDESIQDEEEIKFIAHLNNLVSLKHAKLIILSRSVPGIATDLHNCCQLSMDEECVSHDIELLIRMEIQKSNRLQKLEAEINTEITSQARGMFLWAVLMLNYVKTAPTRNIALEYLSQSPKKLEEVYEKFLVSSHARLGTEKTKLRSEVLQILVVTRRPLSVAEISHILALKSASTSTDEADLLLDPAVDILDLCWPLVTVRDEHAELMHQSVRDFLTKRNSLIPKCSGSRCPIPICHKYMALKCFFELLQARKGSIANIKTLLETNCELIRDADKTNAHAQISVSGFYEYACKYWSIHLLSSDLDLRLLIHARIFLKTTHFIAWAESIYYNQQAGPILELKSRIECWIQSLPNAYWKFLGRRDFLQPFSTMLNSVEQGETDQYLVLLLLYRLGRYANLGIGDPRDICSRCKEKALIVFGPNHRLTLRAIAELAFEKANDHEFEVAERELANAHLTQLELLGDQVMDGYLSLQYHAVVLYRRMRFQDAAAVQQKASAGLLRILGPTHLEYLKGQYYLGRTLEALGEALQALKLLEETWNTWCALQGKCDPFSMCIQGCMGVTLRKLQNFELSKRHFNEAFENRWLMYGNRIIHTADLAIQLTVLKRDMHDTWGAFHALDRASKLFDHKENLTRKSQVDHLRALLLIDIGQIESALYMFDKLSEAARSSNGLTNREFLRAKLSWASLLRARGFNEEVAPLFADLTILNAKKTDKDEGRNPWPEDCPLVEQALRQVYAGDLAGSIELLASVDRSWKTVESFYLPLGGPLAEVS